MRALPAAGLVVILILVSVGAAAASPFAYIPTSGLPGGTVTVLDTGTNTIVASVTVGGGPSNGGPNQVAGSPDGTRVYTSNHFCCSDDSVSAIDTATNTVAATLPLPGAKNVNGLAVSPNGSRVYVAVNSSPGFVYVIDATTMALVTTVQVGNAPNAVAVSPDGSRLYVPNYFSNTVSVIDTTTNAVIGTIGGVGPNPLYAAMNPDGSHVYVTNNGQGRGTTVSAIATASNNVTTISVGMAPQGVAVTPDGSRLYVANGDGTVSVIDATTNGTIVTLPVSSNADGVAITPDGARVYITNTADNSVSVIATATNTVAVTVSLGAGSVPTAGSGNFIVSRVVPFASFTANAQVNVGAGTFHVNGTFTLGAASRGINPVTDPVTIGLGAFNVTIPAGSFRQTGNGGWLFLGIVNGVGLNVKITPQGGPGRATFGVNIQATGAALAGTPSPVTVRLTIGQNSGSAAAQTRVVP